MKKYITPLLLIVLLADPVLADHKQLSHQEMVKWSGCQAELVTGDDHSPAESFYQPASHTLYVGTSPDPSIPEYVHTMILLHEIGHCLQAQAGYLYELGNPARELDADRISVDLACALGMDGRSMIHDVFMWAFEAFGYIGDYAHGTSAERIAQGKKAKNCDKQYESPWAL